MADLAFLDKLDPEQFANANKLIDKANDMGIDPVIALSVAYQESQLKHFNDEKKPKLGGAGEIGLMQVKPTTAEMLGFSPKDLSDPDKNLEIGLTYLRQGMDRYKDPVLAVAGYNAGYDHPFFNDPSKPLPESTMNYLESIKGLGAFNTQKQEKPSVEAPASQEDFEKQKALALANYKPDIDRDIKMGLMGAGVGAGLGTAYSVGSKGAQIADALTKISQPTQSSGSPQGVRNWALSQGYGDRGAQTYKKAHEAESGQRKGATINNRTPTFRFSKSPAVEPSTSVSGALGTASKSPTVQGALTGFLTGAMGQEASARMANQDTAGAVLAGLGSAGPMISKIPYAPARMIGRGLTIASPMGLAILDRMRNATPESSTNMLTNVDPMGNPMP
jgi:Transglycosylase SLT domain